MVGVALLAVALVASFFGPATILTTGPPPPGSGQEVQLLSLLTAAGALALALATWRARFGTMMAGICVAIGGLAAGVYLAFGYWVPALHGATTLPYTFQGAS